MAHDTLGRRPHNLSMNAISRQIVALLVALSLVASPQAQAVSIVLQSMSAASSAPIKPLQAQWNEAFGALFNSPRLATINSSAHPATAGEVLEIGAGMTQSMAEILSQRGWGPQRLAQLDAASALRNEDFRAALVGGAKQLGLGDHTPDESELALHHKARQLRWLQSAFPSDEINGILVGVEARLAAIGIASKAERTAAALVPQSLSPAAAQAESPRESALRLLAQGKDVVLTMRDPRLLNERKAAAVRGFFAEIDKVVSVETLDQISLALAPKPADAGRSGPHGKDSVLEPIDKIVDSIADPLKDTLKMDLREEWAKRRSTLLDHPQPNAAQEEGSSSALSRVLANGASKALFVKQIRVALGLVRSLFEIEQAKVFAALTPSDGLGPKITTTADLAKDAYYAVNQALAIATLMSATTKFGAALMAPLSSLSEKDIDSALSSFSLDATRFDEVKQKFFGEYLPQVLKSADRLGPFYTKLLQTIATFARLLSEQTADTFSPLNNQLAKNMPIQQVYDIVEQDLGVPATEAFLEIEPIPFASASMAQVHRAKIRLPSGEVRRVVIKVLKSSVADELAWNLRVNKAFLDWFKALSGDPFILQLFGDQLEELGKTFQAETDFRAEMERLIRWRLLFRFDRGIDVPRAYRTHSGKRLITMDEVLEARGTNFASQLSKLPQLPVPSAAPEAPPPQTPPAQIPAEKSELPAPPVEIPAPKTDSVALPESVETETPAKETTAPLPLASILGAVKDILFNSMTRYQYRVGAQYFQVMRSLLPFLAISITSERQLAKVDDVSLTDEQLRDFNQVKSNLDAYQQAYWNQLLFFGEVHADMQPENVLHNQESLHLIDLGNVVKTRGMLWRPLSFLIKIAKGDALGAAMVLERMGQFKDGTQQADVIAMIQKVLDENGLEKQSYLGLISTMFSKPAGHAGATPQAPAQAPAAPKPEKLSVPKPAQAPKAAAANPLAGTGEAILAQALLFPLRWMKYTLLGGVSSVLHAFRSNQRLNGRAASAASGKLLQSRPQSVPSSSPSPSRPKTSKMQQIKALALIASIVGGAVGLIWLQIASFTFAAGPSDIPRWGTLAYFAYVAYRYFRPEAKAPADEEAGPTAKAIARISVDGDDAAAVSAVEKALLRLAKAGIAIPVQRIDLVESTRGNDASRYEAAYDPEARVFTLAAKSLSTRLRATKKQYLEFRNTINLDDVAIPILFREAARAGLAGKPIASETLEESGFTTAPGYLIGDLAIQEALRLTRPQTLLHRLGDWLKRHVISLAALAALFGAAPLVLHTLGGFRPDLIVSTGLWLSAKAALATSLFSLVSFNAVSYASKGRLSLPSGAQPPSVNPFSLLFTAFAEEFLYRWGLFGGLLYWLQLASIGAVAPLMGAAIISSYVFARQGSVSDESRWDRFIAGLALSFVFFATQNIYWAALTNALHSLFKALGTVKLEGLDASTKRKALARLATTTSPARPARQ